MEATPNFPPPHEEYSGEEPRWISAFWFAGRITETALELAKERIDHLSHLYPQDEKQGIAFGVTGQMDVAVVHASEAVRPLVQQSLVPQLRRVVLIPKQDAVSQIEEQRRIKSYDITRTIFDLLDIKIS